MDHDRKRNLRTLKGEGLIEIVMVEADMRRRAVWLTETGARRLEAAIPVWREAHAKLEKMLLPDLARALADKTGGFGSGIMICWLTDPANQLAR